MHAHVSDPATTHSQGHPSCTSLCNYVYIVDCLHWPQRPSALPRLPPVTVEEWERFRDDWGRITTDSELKFRARVFYGVMNSFIIILTMCMQ